MNIKKVVEKEKVVINQNIDEFDNNIKFSEQTNTEKIKNIINSKFKQLHLKNKSIIFAIISENIDNPFGLLYWYKKAENFDDFIFKINEFFVNTLQIGELTEQKDIDKLNKQYELGEKLYGKK